MKPIAVSVEVKAPVARVFDVFTDLENCVERVPAILEVVFETNQHRGKGTRWQETREVMGKQATETMEMTEYEQDSRYVVGCDSHGAYWETIFRFHDHGESTRVDCNMSVEARTFGAKMMTPMLTMMRGTMEKCMTGDFDALKAVCESDNP